jgi:hypothetical protein
MVTLKAIIKQDELQQFFCIQSFYIRTKPEVYEFSDIDMTPKRRIPPDKDYFTLMDFSAKWDPILVCYARIILS